MAAPLFISDLDALKSLLRLSGSTQTDTLQMIEQAVAEARMTFYDFLGTDRVAQLVAITSVDAPATTDQILRSKAETTEMLLVRTTLLRRMPILFMETGGAKQSWNEDGLTRDMGALSIDKEIGRLESQTNQYLSDLVGSAPISGTVEATILQPDITPPRIGDSIWRRRGCFG